ncbi:MAG: sensor histidine kinase [Lutibacter sp.]
MKIKKTYAFAFWSALYLGVFSLFLFYFLDYYFLKTALSLLISFVFFAVFFVLAFIIIQYRIEKFIYQRIKKIYNDVSILDEGDLDNTTITSDMNKLSRDVEKFAKLKQEQIKLLNLRENYRKEFLGNVSHELKTPLFTVQGYLLTLADGALNNKLIRKKYLERANIGVERLIAIVKDLDLISKLESANLTIKKEPFNIVKLVEEVFDLLEMKAKKRNVSLVFNKNYEYPVMVVADEEKIEQVLINLIVNSIKYGKINGLTEVSFDSYTHDKILVTVKDNGEGIKKEHQLRLFERFYRVDKSRSREQGGSGLGLAIVKHIVEAHNESIFVKSEYLNGAEFSFTLEKVEKF